MAAVSIQASAFDRLVTDDVKAPFVFEDECGGIFYIDQHLPNAHARVAFALHLTSEGMLEPDEAYRQAIEASVCRRWYRPDPADEYGDRMIACRRTAPGAHPFTVIGGES